jgi:ribonuclease BN (tRNA processing enzyme)
MADFIIAPWVMGRQEPLLIYGPKGSQKMTEGLLDVYKIGIDEHLYGISPLTHPLLVQAKDYEAGEIYRDQWVTIEAFRVQHGNLDAFGFKVVTPDKSIVFSGDTCPVPALIEHAQGCDILVHEVYCHASLYEAHPQWISYFTQVHTSGIELAEIAKQVQPKLLVLTHQMSWGDYSKADLMKEITDGYDGKVVYGNDLDVFN